MNKIKRYICVRGAWDIMGFKFSVWRERDEGYFVYQIDLDISSNQFFTYDKAFEAGLKEMIRLDGKRAEEGVLYNIENYKYSQHIYSQWKKLAGE